MLFNFLKKSKFIFKLILLATLLIWVGQKILPQWNQDAFWQLTPNWGFLLMSILFLILFFLFQAYIAFLLLNTTLVSLKDFFPIYFLSQLGRYIPGKIWMIIGKIELLKHKGVSRRWSTTIAFLEILLMLGSACLIICFGGIFLRLPLSQKISPFWAGIILITGLLLSMLLYKKILLSLAQYFPKVSEKINFILQILPQIPFKKVTIYFTLNWILIGIGFYLLIQSFYPVTVNIFYVGLIFIFAWTVGFLSFLSPSGIGVRESLLFFLLAGILPKTEATLIAVISRIWFTGIELLLTLIILGIKHYQNFNFYQLYVVYKESRR